MTVAELIAALSEQPQDAEVSAFTEFTAAYGEGVWVHIAKVAFKSDVGVLLEEDFSR